MFEYRWLAWNDLKSKGSPVSKANPPNKSDNVNRERIGFSPVSASVRVTNEHKMNNISSHLLTI